MTLNPEEVVNKRFRATKLRQGYDEEEVDEFLDEVVTELRRLNAANADLRSKLATCEGRVIELATGSSGPAADPVNAPVVAAAPVPAPAPEVAAAAAAPVASESVSESDSRSDAGSVVGMLALAQKLHDEHVAEGRAKGEQLLADAQGQAARLVQEAETTSRETLGTLKTQRQELEAKVEQLRSFEREYRSRLKSYLQSQLRELEPSGTPAGGASPDRTTTPGSGDAATARSPLGG